MKTLQDITLYDIMAESCDVWINPNKQFGFDLQIDDENGQSLVDEKGVHLYAANALAEFCRDYLAIYDQALKRRVA
jgi:hypothetical protein